jgi:purine-binding chemotaxis protein CheW
MSNNHTNDNNDFLVFSLGQQPFALPVRQVSTVVPRARLAPLTGAPADLIGVLRLRGALFPVVDLRARLGLAPEPAHLGQCIVVMQTSVGLLVDGVEGLVHAAPNPLELTMLDAEVVIGAEVRAYLATIAGEPRRLGESAAA